MKALVIIICAVVFGGSALALWACIVMAGRCSREEERAMVLKPCPVCHKVPHLGYCCGEYFVSGDDPDCPGCGTAFTEMHSSPGLEIEAWNRRASMASELKPCALAFECKHCMAVQWNEIGEKLAYCEIWDEWKNITLGDCVGNCESQEETSDA